MGIKRTLTTLQITQFLVGASYAMCHSFVSYVAPILLTKETSAATPLNDTPAALVDAAVPVASGALDALKQLVFGGNAANEVVAQLGNISSAGVQVETVYITQPCIATTGETFAIWLNVVYLAPLTYLFVSFFIASYVKRSNADRKVGGRGSRRLSNNVTLAEKAGWDAAKSIENEVYGGEKMLDGTAIEETAAPKTTTRSSKRRA